MEPDFKYRYSDNLLLYRNNLANGFGLLCILLFTSLIIVTNLGLINPIENTTVQIQIILFLYFFIVTLSAIWAYKIARRKNYYASIWVLITIYSGPIGLMIIGNLDYYFKNRTVKRIVKNTRKEFFEKIKNNDHYNLQTVKEYLGIIETRLNDERTKEYENLSTLTSASENSDLNKYINEKIKSIDTLNANTDNEEKLNWDPSWQEQENVCPACGTELNSNSKFCNKCGLRIT